MPAPFAAMEQRLNGAVFRHLANALASVGGGALLPAVFDDSYTRGGVGGPGMASSDPALQIQDSTLSSDLVGATVQVYGPDGVTLQDTYIVVHREPDGTGVTRLILERVL